MIRRREFITLLGGATGWPLAARAQQSAMPVIGYLSSGASTLPVDLRAFRQGLSEGGFVEGHNIAIEFRFARDQNDLLPTLATELVQKQVAAIFTTGGVAPALAAKAATTTIPIVFAHGSDPVRTGLVASINRPGGNVTGVTFVTGILQAKSLELLHEIVPRAQIVGVLVNPITATGENRLKDVEAAASALNIRLSVVGAGAPNEIDAAIAKIAQERAGALLVVADPMFRTHYKAIVEAASRHSLPLISFARDFVEAGALMSYGTNISDSFRQAGVYVGRILNGTKPTDLPVLQPTKLELLINLKTAQMLGLTVPLTLQAAADEVIE